MIKVFFCVTKVGKYGYNNIAKCVILHGIKMTKKTCIFILLICFSINLSAGRIKKGMNALDIYNYFDAKKHFEKALKRDLVAGSYGLSVIYLRKDNPFYNIDSAYNCILRATNNYSSLTDKKKIKYRQLRIDSVRIFEQRNSISDAHYTRAKSIHTLEKYDDFLVRHPWSKWRDSSIYFRDYLALQTAESIGNSAAYADFIKTYPASEFTRDAQSTFDRLAYQERTKDNNFIDYVSFIKDYPESPYRADAEDQVYKIYTKTGSLKAYQKFIESYPENRNVKNAWKKMFNTYLQNDYSTNSIKSFMKEFSDYPFQEDLKRQLEFAAVELLPIKERNKWGYIAKEGTIQIKPTFDGAEEFYEGMAIISLEGKYGFINKMGEIVIDPIFDDAYQINEGHAVVEIQDHLGIINRSGEFVIQPDYEDLGNLTEGLSYFSQGEFYGYFDEKGIIRLKEQYTSASDFKNGKAIVSKQENYGLIDRFGTTAIPFKYERLKEYVNGVYTARLDDKWGLLSETGDTITSFKYDFIGPLRSKRAIVELDGKFNYIDLNGNEILPEWIDVYAESRQRAFFSEYYAKIQFEDGFNLIDTTGKKIFSQNKEDLDAYISPYYEKIESLNDSLFLAKSRGNYGVLTIQGDTLINFQYLSIEPFAENIVQLETRKAVYYYNLKQSRFLKREE